jgi:mono/diheme cytochrome c family protein
VTGRTVRVLALPGALAVPGLLALLAAASGACAAGERHDAAALYRANCARCHGEDGKGDRRSIGLYPNLDLTASPLARAGPRGRGAIARRISEGYGAMPGFGNRLDAEELRSLTDYVPRLARGERER